MSTFRPTARLGLVLVALAASCSKKDPDFKPQDAGILADAPPDAPPGSETIGGTVTGLSGAGLVLQNSGADDLSVTSNGPFQFTTSILQASTYMVTASQQPTGPSQSCTVANGSGTANNNVTDVTVICTTNAYNVSGNVYGLTAGMVSLQLNGGNATTITANDGSAQPFMFSTPLNSGQSFLVTVSSQPPTPLFCSVSGGDSTIGNGDVSGISVSCAANQHAISGTVTGLNGTVTLSDGTGMTSTSNAAFAFPPLVDGTMYSISIVSNPIYVAGTSLAQTCNVTNDNSGTLSGSDITDVQVMCNTNPYTVGGTLYQMASGGSVTLHNGGDTYPVTANGTFAFPTSVDSGMTYNVSVTTQPTGQTCELTNSTGTGTVTNGNVTSVQVDCDSGIQCGKTAPQSLFCPTSQVCCDPEQVYGAASCTTGANNCTTGSGINKRDKFSMPCADSTDCLVEGKGAICCASEDSQGAVYSVDCSSCTGSREYELCDPDAPAVCASGKSCSAFGALPGYYACQ